MRETVFFASFAVFVASWAILALVYLTIILPSVARQRGLKSLFEAGLQLNFAGHLRTYREMAKARHDRRMFVVWYLTNALVVFGCVAFLIGVLSTIEL